MRNLKSPRSMLLAAVLLCAGPLVPGCGGQLSVECADDLECDDGIYCNGEESCQVGHCRVGEAVTCLDGVECTQDWCSEQVSGCVFEPRDEQCPSGWTCNATAGCLPPCVVDADCDDGDPCTGQESCVLDACQAGEPPDCSDGHACTLDECIFGVGCRHVPDHEACGAGMLCTVESGCVSGGGCIVAAECDDGFACDGEELCVAGSCVAGEAPCDDQVSCTRDSCDESTGVCGHLPIDADCMDGNPCTDDSCSAEGCTHENISDITIACDDGNECTWDDSCLNGHCVGAGVDCDDSDPCTRDSCDPEDGCRSVPDDTICDDGNPCTLDACAALGGEADCSHEPDDAADCDDEDLCTLQDACAAGSCAGMPRDCDDQIGCTTDACDSATGDCTHTADDSACSIFARQCVASVCDVQLDCRDQPLDEVPCDDSNSCTGDDTCRGGECSGTPITGAECEDPIGHCVDGECCAQEYYCTAPSITSMILCCTQAEDLCCSCDCPDHPEANYVFCTGERNCGLEPCMCPY